MWATWTPDKGKSFAKGEDVWPDVHKVIKRIVTKHHPNLKSASIGVLFQKEIGVRGYTYAGKVDKGSDKYAVLFGKPIDFVLLLNWHQFSSTENIAKGMTATLLQHAGAVLHGGGKIAVTGDMIREAWLDDLLPCCAGDRVDGFFKVQHSVWCWPEVMQRHGWWMDLLQAKLTVSRQGRQDSLDLNDTGDDGESLNVEQKEFMNVTRIDKGKAVAKKLNDQLQEAKRTVAKREKASKAKTGTKAKKPAAKKKGGK